MAKRQAVQIQADLQTDDDFAKFIELSGLLVIDVYTEWCGPCVAMLNAIKKVKLEQGGDLLNLAIARADSISILHRFYRKSEPTWLFIAQGRTVNILFGANCPKLIDLILAELARLGKVRETFNIAEMLPIEIQRDNIKNAAKRENLQRELDERAHQKSEYFHYVTDAIRENLPDVGITIFGPHINRDSFRHLVEHGPEKFGIACKDRRTQVITKEQFETINFVCKNPLSPDVLEAFDGKEVFVCFWKISNDSQEPIAEILQRYADDIVKSHKIPPDEYNSEEQVLPPLATAAKVKIQYVLPVDQECPIEIEEQEAPKELAKHQKVADATAETTTAQDDINRDEDDEGEGEEKDEGEGPIDEPNPEPLEMPVDLDFDPDADMQSEGEEEEEIIDDLPKMNICTKTVTVPAIWVPKDWRTHAAVIYLIFRTQTTGFLPPDPVPEPPHVIMAFDTYKKKDLISFAERNKEDVPLYGFFTSDEAEEAKFIANSKTSYAHYPAAASDKLIFKVNKRTSHTMLSLATYGPTYVSPNTTVGAEEAKIFFPEDYVTAEQELIEALAKKEAARSKGKKVSKTAEELAYERLQTETETTAKDGEEQGALETEAVAVVEAEGEEALEASEGEVAGEAGAEEIGEGAELPTNEQVQQAQTEEAAVEAIGERGSQKSN